MEHIEKWIGISAGKICFSNFEEYDFFINQMIAQAEIIWESGRSAWTLYSQDVNGTTRWLSPDETQIGMVLPNGQIAIEQID